MRISKIGLIALCAIVLSGPALAEDAMWKDGMLFTQEELTSLQGHKAFKSSSVSSRDNAPVRSRRSVNGSR